MKNWMILVILVTVAVIGVLLLKHEPTTKTPSENTAVISNDSLPLTVNNSKAGKVDRLVTGSVRVSGRLY